MPNVVWDEKLSLGIEQIDSQHKNLIRLSNRLLRAIRQGRDRYELCQLFHQLSEYTVYHFNDEERYMQRLGFPKFVEHQELHVQLKREVREFQSRIFHQDEILPEEVKAFIKKWLLDHIMHCDMDIAMHKARVDHDGRVNKDIVQ